MSQLIDDVKTGLKGVRGAGDALRGSLMEAADQTLDTNSKHPDVTDRENKNRTIKERGKADMRGVDEMFARHEWDRKNRVNRGENSLAQEHPSYNQANTVGTEMSSVGPMQTERQDVGHITKHPEPQEDMRNPYEGSHVMTDTSRKPRGIAHEGSHTRRTDTGINSNGVPYEENEGHSGVPVHGQEMYERRL